MEKIEAKDVGEPCGSARLFKDEEGKRSRNK